MKTCTRCNETKPLIKFRHYVTKSGQDRYVRNCLNCASLDLKMEQKRKRQENPTCIHCSCVLVLGTNWNASMQRECCYTCKNCHKSHASQTPEANKNHKLMRAFNISLDDYQKMFTAQNGVCEICKEPEKFSSKGNEKAMSLAVDHDHDTGKIRSLLCLKCNRGLGLFEEDANKLSAAINYIKKHKARHD